MLSEEHNSPLRQQRYRRTWLDRQRNFFIRQIFADFFALTYSFQELYQSYCTCRAPEAGGGCYLSNRHDEQARCGIWDQLTIMLGSEVEKGPLWTLKDLCQRVWPEEGAEKNIENSLIGWLARSIFHEALKLKEDVYILNSYSAAALRYNAQASKKIPQGFPAASRLARVMDRKGLVQRIAVDVMRQMEQLAFLFGQTNNFLRTMLPGLSDNILLIRFLVEKEDMVEELWGEHLTAVFEDMFPRRVEQGFCAAGRSYMQGDWYTRSLIMYRRALEICPECAEALEKSAELEDLIKRSRAFLGAA